MKKIITIGICLLWILNLSCQNKKNSAHLSENNNSNIQVGAEQLQLYIPLIKDKQVVIVANQTSRIGNIHLVDTLLNLGINIVKVFGPEHGFRGGADAGQLIENNTDVKTGIRIISLYGDHKKPTPEDLENVDVVIFDIQDVGARFYTYISTMTYIMEACAQNDIPFIVLDRPNPNGDYVDGPVLKKGFESFVGMHPVPIVHGMTVGEYAKMVNGEGWLENGLLVDLTVIPIKNWNHSLRYSLPVSPSPNLPNDDAICLYPSICLFEGTVVSVGRGTGYPFQVLGHPLFMIGSYTFKPESRPGAKYPKLEGKQCYGQSLAGFAEHVCYKERQIHLSWLINYYNFLKDTTDFFNDYFDTLAGDSTLRKQIVAGLSEEEIKATWQDDLDQFKSIRKKYLLYQDFE